MTALALSASLLVATTGFASAAPPAPATPYTFQSVADPADPTFTQLLGINDQQTIAGYYGSGQVVDGTLHPNKGFTLTLPNTFTSENYPTSAQTQVVAINNAGDTGGFYVDNTITGTTHGFLDVGGAFATVDDPAATFMFNQILGLNNKGQAVGYYQDANNGAFHPYIYTYSNTNPGGGTFTHLANSYPQLSNAQATGVNDGGLVSGFYIDANNITHGYLLSAPSGGTLTTLDYPTTGVTVTQALGVNNAGQVVGQYVDPAGTTHGFLYQNGTYQSIDVSFAGATATTINGINNAGQIVGFYTDANGNIVGFVGAPAGSGGGGGAATPELGSGELLGAGLLPLGLALLYRRRRARRA